jgi:hypothetical protein
MRRNFLAAAFLLASTIAALAGGFSGDGFGTPGFFQYLSIAAPPSGGMFTPVFSTLALPTSGAATEQGAVQSSLSQNGLATTAALRRVPIPIPGTVSALTTSMGTSQAAGPQVIDQFNGTSGTVGCAYAAGPPTACTDPTHSDHVAAGALMQWLWTVPTGAWAQAATPFSTINFLFQGDNLQEGLILSGPTSQQAVSAAAFATPGTGSLVGSATAGNAIMPTAGSIAGLFAYPNGPDSGANVHSYVLFKNGSATGMTCSNASNPSLGCCITVTTTPENVGGNPLATCTTGATPITYAVGDSMVVEILCGGTCSAINPGIGLVWDPTTTNQVPLFTTTVISASAVFSGVSDQNTTATVSQLAYQNLPAPMTFGGLISCMPFTTSGGTWTSELLSGPIGTAPATVAGPIVNIPTATTCPGGGGGVPYLAGTQDTTHTASLVATNNVGIKLFASAGSPSGGGGQWKTGMWVTVP